MEPTGNAKPDAVGIVSRLCGVQAQVASSAALAVALRQNKARVRLPVTSSGPSPEALW